MKMSLRQLFAPAFLAVALMPLAFTAQADQHDGQGMDREAMKERMEERRQEVYQRAELSEEQQAALDEAHAEHREAVLALREEHQARVAEILSEEEQQALSNAMHEMLAEYRQERGHGGHGKRGHHDDAAHEMNAE
ncbi:MULTISPECIES: hypothetical protein [unclassified Halomonas]|uniref:hypothetical protein n=1 Tax=unclassified Halomonas TaxID=2609666 RepID=UPI001EF4C151|nr:MULTISPECIES: hypothetical protein [unclassified Halomonas]MCG7576075.1 hypothetical protein [Halomonas sp. MMH1-48]MCG7603146.1 hypothetical protein [Halomonas sp. MM17-34]MCG7612396.1 hypothetical protein [Halomonas sp. MM17-29]MCG7619277.1 hypothetical protein [Halomonas sp. DSH1-27]